MSNDLSYLITKKENKENGRKGYFHELRERVNPISPKKYGECLVNRKRDRK